MTRFSDRIGSILWAIALCLFFIVSAAYMPKMVATFIQEVQNNISEIQK